MTTAVTFAACTAVDGDDRSAGTPTDTLVPWTANTAATTTTPPTTAPRPEPDRMEAQPRGTRVEDSCTPAAVEISVIYRHVDGVDPNQTSLDLVHPDGCHDRPLVVWVHGGGWTGGDKVSPTSLRKKVWAAANDWVFAAVNYRLTGSGGARWPDHGDDVAAAVRHLVQHAEAFGIDPDRIALLGHSAGGHIVTTIASGDLLEQQGLPRSTVDCVVSLDGVAYWVDQNPMVPRRTVTAVFGDDMESLQAASPGHLVDRRGPPEARLLLVTRGSAGNRAIASSFHELVTRRGGRSELLDVSPLTHTAVADTLGGDNPFTGATTAFLRQCLAGADERPEQAETLRSQDRGVRMNLQRPELRTVELRRTHPTGVTEASTG